MAHKTHAQFLYREVPKRANKPYVVVDMETDGLGGPFALGAIAWRDDDGRLRYQFFESIESLIRLMISRWGRAHDWYAHNGAGYDYKYLLNEKTFIRTRGWSLHVLSSGTVNIGAKLTQGHKTVNLKDFYRIAPAALKELAAKFHVPHQKLDMDWENERFNPHNDVHRRYLIHDVLGFYEVIEAFMAAWQRYFHTPLGWTTPASAMKAWKATIPEGHVYYRLKKEIRDWIRLGYYGGMVRVRHNEWSPASAGDKIVGWDVNSMYPAMMKKGVPVGTPIHAYGCDYEPDMPGFWRVVADVPEDTHYTILPLRDNAGTKFPTGHFETVCTNLEIEFARSLGHTVTVLDGYYWEKTEYIFTEFIQVCETIRREHKGSPFEFIAKLAQNSLYGKFGAKEDGEHIQITNAPEEDGWEPFIDEHGFPIDGVWKETVEIDESYLHPEWAAWITAQARVHLSRVAEPLARTDRLVYTDTDSVKAIVRPTDPVVLIDEDALRYGAWKREVEADYWAAGGPKTYTFHQMHYQWTCPTCRAKVDATVAVCGCGYRAQTEAERYRQQGWVWRAKGIPTKRVLPPDIVHAAHGERVGIRFDMLRGMSYLVKHGLTIQLEQNERTLTTPDHVLNWQFNGQTWRPVYVNQTQDERDILQREWEAEQAAARKARRRTILQTVLPRGIWDPDYNETLPRALKRKTGRGLDTWVSEVADALGEYIEDANGLWDIIMDVWRP